MKCDCCKVNDSIGVASSGYAAMSFAWCAECLNRGAEPMMILFFLYWYMSDRGKGLVDDSLLPSTYMDGKYVTWAEFKALEDKRPKPQEVIDYENGGNDE